MLEYSENFLREVAWKKKVMEVVEESLETEQTPSLRTLCLRSKKRTLDLFMGNHGSPVNSDPESLKVKLACKIHDEYAAVKDLPPPARPTMRPAEEMKAPTRRPIVGVAEEEETTVLGTHKHPSRPGVIGSSEAEEQPFENETDYRQLIQSIPGASERELPHSSQLVAYQRNNNSLVSIQQPTSRSKALALRNPYSVIKPEWHPPWKLMRVISGHLGWVRCVAFDPSNEWFVTGAADRTIKVWDLASGTLKLTLTGHINAVRGLAVSQRNPYLFSCAEDKKILCWDLEYNKSIRHYHGHLSAVYSLALHPSLDLMVTGGRDSSARVWDIRTSAPVFVLQGHTDTVGTVACQSTDPQVISGSQDTTVRLWDLAAGKCQTTLTHHKKSVRSIVLHPEEFSMASASPDNIKHFMFPEGKFLKNWSGHQAVVNTLAINRDNVLVSGADNGSMHFWDWKTGYCFQKLQTAVQPGSLEAEAGICALAYDHTGSRLISCEIDKTIKIYKEDESATPETHPIEGFKRK